MVLSWLVFASPGAGALEIEPILQEIQPRRLGVDAQDHLWMLHPSWTRITQVSPGGERTSWRIPKSWYVDVDSRWGAAALDPYGKELRIVTPDGRVRALLPMEHEAGDVAWIDENRVAVTPTRAAHRVEIWDVQTGSLVRTFGEEEAIAHRIGAYFVRRVYVEYDEGSKRLHTVETRTGEYRAFDLEGRELVAHKLDNPKLAKFEAWIERVDRERSPKGEDLGMPLNWFRLGFDAKGTPITVANCAADGSQASLFRLPKKGAPEPLELEVACCTKQLAIWQNQLLLAGASAVPDPTCFTTRSFP